MFVSVISLSVAKVLWYNLQKPRKSHRYTKKANPINDESVAPIADRQRQVVLTRSSAMREGASKEHSRWIGTRRFKYQNLCKGNNYDIGTTGVSMTNIAIPLDFLNNSLRIEKNL